MEISLKPIDHDPKAWAHALRRRHLECDRLTRFQIDAYREVLAAEEEKLGGDEAAKEHDRREAARRRVEEYAAEKGLEL
jgi:hypothetical protein